MIQKILINRNICKWTNTSNNTNSPIFCEKLLYKFSMYSLVPLEKSSLFPLQKTSSKLEKYDKRVRENTQQFLIGCTCLLNHIIRIIIEFIMMKHIH